jgi:hypothetical protein
MTFWDDASSDLEMILDDTIGSSVEVTHTPHAGGAASTLRVVLISQGRAEDANAYKVTAHAYFSGTDLSSPKYQDLLETSDGEAWKLMRDIGSNDTLKRWEVEQDIRSKFSEGQR